MGPARSPCPALQAQVRPAPSFLAPPCPPEPGAVSKRRRQTPNVTLAPSCSVSGEETVSSFSSLVLGEAQSRLQSHDRETPGAEEGAKRKSKFKKIKTICRSRGCWR